MNAPFSLRSLSVALGLALLAPTASQAGDNRRHDHDRDGHDHDGRTEWSHGRYFGHGYGYRGYYDGGYYFGGYRPYFYSPWFYGGGYAYYNEPVYQGGGYGEDLAVAVQRELRRLGYYRGPLDGDIGAGSRAAIRRFQTEHRLAVNGRVDRELVWKLGLN